MSPTSRSPGAQLSGRRHAPAGRVSRPGGHRAVWSAGSRVTAPPANQAHASNPRPVPRCTHTPRGSAGPAPVGLPGPVEHLPDPRRQDPPPDTGRSLGSVAPGSGFSSATGGSRPPSPAPEPDPPAPHTPAHRPAKLTHPLVQRLTLHTEITRHLGDRPPRPHHLSPKLRTETADASRLTPEHLSNTLGTPHPA